MYSSFSYIVTSLSLYSSLLLTYTNPAQLFLRASVSLLFSLFFLATLTMENYVAFESPNPNLSSPVPRPHFEDLCQDFEQLRLFCYAKENRSSVWPYSGSSIRTHEPEDYTNLNYVPRALYPDNIWRYDHLNTNTVHAGNHTDISSLNNVGFGDLFSDFVDFDESKSAYLIKKMEERHPYWTPSVFDRLFESIAMLMTQPYGHRVFVKLIELCDQYRLQLIVAEITADHGRFLNASQNQYGSTSIKKLIRVLARSPLISTIIAVLSSSLFFTLMTNQTGFHVILTCLNTLNTQQNQLLYKAATENCLLLAVHKAGCRNLQKFIENIGTLDRHNLLYKVCQSSLRLSQDPIGNYVVQHVLGLDHPLYTNMICSKLKGHFARLSMQQGASNVVERCLRFGGMECTVEDLILEKNKSFLQLARDAYGNYVIQTALKVTMDARSTSPLHKKLAMKLETCLNALQISKYGRNVVQLLEQQKAMLFDEGRSDLSCPSVV